MKTIEFDPCDIQSINKAIEAIEKHEVWRKQKITEYIHKLCLVGAEAAKKTYGGLIHVEVTPDGKGIIGIGDQVVFLEFGTGVKVQDHPELSNTLPIDIMPGSWSESPEGKHTWSTWLEGGYIGKDKQRWIQRRFDEYPYNTEPRPGMWEAYKAILANQDRIAKEVFEDDRR